MITLARLDKELKAKGKDISDQYFWATGDSQADNPLVELCQLLQES